MISEKFWAVFFGDKFSGPHWDHLALWCFYALLWKSRWPLGGFPLFLAFFSPFCPFIFRHIFRPHKRHFGTKMVSFCGVISRSFLDHFGMIFGPVTAFWSNFRTISNLFWVFSGLLEAFVVMCWGNQCKNGLPDANECKNVQYFWPKKKAVTLQNWSKIWLFWLYFLLFRIF